MKCGAADSSCRITVVVVAYHGERWLAPCLGTLGRASRERVHLLLVDNSGNNNAIPADCPQFDYTVVSTPQPLGFAEANNFALTLLAKSSAEAICFLNQDTQSEPGWLDACMACFDHDPQLGAVAPLLRTYDNTDWDQGFYDCARAAPDFLRAIGSGEPLAECYHVPRVTAAAMLVRTGVLLDVGPFDPIFGSYYEDYDLCRRIREAGHRIGIAGQATVCHYAGSATTSEQARRKRMRQIIRNRAILRFREAGNKRWSEVLRYATGTFPYNLCRSLLRTSSSQPLRVQLDANWDLLLQWKRLLSAKHDRRTWANYLDRIGWPSGAHVKQHSLIH